jgi:enoyl-CoA hydratase/carnithine racemase
MVYEGYEFLKIRTNRGVAFATLDHPPINLLNMEVNAELLRLAGEIAQDDEIKVIVFDSANPDFFLAHFDVTVLTALAEMDDLAKAMSVDLHDANKAGEAYRRLPKISIAKIQGRARGGESEFLLGLDMRFAALGKAVLGQPEVALGIIPGGGGTQRLPRLIGQARALEVIVGCGDVTAEVAERYGYVNRALPPEELEPFVQELAYRIASFPAEAVATAKAKFMECGGQTPEGERDWSAWSRMYERLTETD